MTDESLLARGRRRAALLAISAACVAALGIFTSVFFWSRPELWTNASVEPAPTFAVQSRSMEPNYNGPRFVWTCPNCGAKFATSFDLGASGGLRRFSDDDQEAEDGAVDLVKEARQALSAARSFACPSCGFDRANEQAPEFYNGAFVYPETAASDVGRWEKFKRALRRESTPKKYDDELLRPERWDVVVFRDRDGRMTLKRVVGLPDERVELRNGDVFIDGRIARRELNDVLATAVRVEPVNVKRADDRIEVLRVTNVWTNGKTEALPTPISNESSVPAYKGGNVAPVELARDFILRFEWLVEPNAPTKFEVLARRVDRALELQYDEGTRSIVLRVKSLFNGKTGFGKPFERLETSDFNDESGRRVELPKEALGASRFVVAIVDGEAILTADGIERARFDLNDLDQTSTAAVATPFVLLGDVDRARKLELFRDLHYSDVRENTPDAGHVVRKDTTFGRATIVPKERYFLLGDNSPASMDSRFDAIGTIDARDLKYKIVPYDRNKIH